MADECRILTHGNERILRTRAQAMAIESIEVGERHVYESTNL